MLALNQRSSDLSFVRSIISMVIKVDGQHTDEFFKTQVKMFTKEIISHWFDNACYGSEIDSKRWNVRCYLYCFWSPKYWKSSDPDRAMRLKANSKLIQEA